MGTLASIPEEGKCYWFYENGQIKEQTEYEAKVLNVIPFDYTVNKYIYKYNEWSEDIEAVPLIDLWIEEVLEWFWLLDKETDFIIELQIPNLCVPNVYAARTVDGEWHAFETLNSKQFGLLDVTGKYYKELHDDLPE